MAPNVPALLNRGKGTLYRVGASQYGGPSDPSSGTRGYKGDNLVGTMAYAELGMGTALGGLPHGQELEISYNGKQVTAQKLDIGLGGSNIDGVPRRIDLWYQTAQALGFNGTGIVTIMKPDGSKLNIPGGKVTAVTPGPDTPVGAANNVASSLTGPLSDIAKIIGFIFSLQFLYVVGGGILLLVGLIMLLRSTSAGKTVTDLPSNIAGRIPIE